MYYSPHIAILMPFLLVSVVLLSLGCSSQADESKAPTSLPSCPRQIPADWLASSGYPRLFCTPVELVSARETVKHTAWGKAYIDDERRICTSFIDMDETSLRALVPKPGSLFVYGAGMNLDPIHQKRMIWCGWNHPFSIKDVDGRVYPNDEWRDDGSGVIDPKTAQRYYFTAQANAFIVKQLEQQVLPALADVYALDGNKNAARAAAILLDQIAVVYPTNRRGPIDYPLDYPDDPTEADRAGRLDRPYYQVARGLMNYANTIDLIAPSGEFDKPSIAGGGLSIREHIIRNLLWDGGAYCLDYAVREYQLYNGHSDYLRGAAVTGILLGQQVFSDPLLHGISGMHAMLDNNIDRSGLYYETSPLYAEHTRELFISMAELFEAAKNLQWKDVKSAYANPAMRLFLTETFDRQEVGGHIPVLGDDGPDAFANDPMRRLPTGSYVLSDNYIKGQILGAWVRLVRSPDQDDRQKAARLLADTFAGKSPVVPPIDRWSIYHIGLDAVEQVQAQRPNTDHFETDSVFYGGKGLALLRGGHGSQRYGAQLFFGPLHNHGQQEALTWSFYARGAEWSMDPGYFQSHYRSGWTAQTVAHQAVTVDVSSIDPDHGSGHLLSWHSMPEVQWTLAMPDFQPVCQLFRPSAARLSKAFHSDRTDEIRHKRRLLIRSTASKRKDRRRSRTVTGTSRIDRAFDAHAAHLVNAVCVEHEDSLLGAREEDRSAACFVQCLACFQCQDIVYFAGMPGESRTNSLFRIRLDDHRFKLCSSQSAVHPENGIRILFGKLDKRLSDSPCYDPAVLRLGLHLIRDHHRMNAFHDFPQVLDDLLFDIRWERFPILGVIPTVLSFNARYHVVLRFQVGRGMSIGNIAHVIGGASKRLQVLPELIALTVISGKADWDNLTSAK